MSFNLYESAYLTSAFPVIKETVPKSSLGYNTNNKYPEFPPLMSDGRSITASYQPESSINNEILHLNNIKSNWEYRNYLVANANQIMETNFRESCNDTGYFVKQYEVPFSNEVVKDTNNPPFHYNKDNLDQKPFGYASSDLKDMYLSREQLNDKKFSEPITQYDLLTRRE
jgi:glucan-binding YG repeat protein